MAEPAKRILLADDESHFTAVLERFMARHGFKVACASTGQDALKLAGDSDFDLALVDVDMPGSGGVELVRQLRAGGVKAPAVIVSGRPVDLDGKLLRELGVRKTFLKPFSLAEILKTANVLTGGAPERTAGGNARERVPEEDEA